MVTSPSLALGQSALPELLDNLNQLLLILISSTYYLDCLSILFLLRFVGQNQIRTGGIRVVLTATVVSIATHALRDIPQPAPREFWNHGGALVDFVGERPTTRFKLLAMDGLVLVLQLLYLTLWYKEAAQHKKTPTEPTQDIEAEEAGVTRVAHSAVETEEGIEMQSLLPGQSQDALDNEQESTILVRRSDLKEVFINTSSRTATDDAGAAVSRFLERLNAIRARRAAQQAQTNIPT